MSLNTHAAVRLRQIATKLRGYTELQREAEILGMVAWRIDGLDKFIRRDNGSRDLHAVIRRVIHSTWEGGLPAMTQGFWDWTEKLRQTHLNYIRGQFKEKAIEERPRRPILDG